MVKFKKLWLFEQSGFQRFLNFIIAQCIAERGTNLLFLIYYSPGH